MEYYFLNDGEKEEATGYLYLEFKKGNRYRTIGIGQQAQKGKAMSFWGFIVLDGRRIGYDFNLYREVGNTKIANTKQEMKRELGENNLFTETQKDYMRFVNKHILLSCKLDAPAPCRLDAPDFGFVCHVLADCLRQHLQVI